MGRAKILGEGRSVVWGYGTAMVLNGVVTFLLREISRTGPFLRPWHTLVLSAAVSAVATLMLFWRARVTSTATGPRMSQP